MSNPWFDTWISDAIWVHANNRTGHIIRTAYPCGTGKTFMSRFALGHAKRDEVLSQIFYGSPIDRPDEMMGLSSCYNSLDVSVVQSAKNVIDGCGVYSLCSVWLIGWAPTAVYMASGNGESPFDSAEGDYAIIVADWRHVVRIANVDSVGRGERILPMMCQALYHMPRMDFTTPVFYMNRDARNLLKDEGLREPENPELDICRGVRIRVVPELRSDEARVL